MKSEKLTKLFTVYLAVFISFITLPAHGQERGIVHVPDSLFRYILTNNYAITFNAENSITNPELAASLRELSINGGIITLNGIEKGGISNLNGIEAFTSLESLSIWNSQLSSLNLSANRALTSLRIEETMLTSLNLSANKALTNLSCNGNHLTNLDLTANTLLTTLECTQNQLTTLNLSANKALIDLNCNNNLLVTLDLSANTQLNTVECSNNKLTQLNLSNGTALTNGLHCAYNQLSHLDFWNMKLPQGSYYKRQDLIYAGNNFPFYYNNFFPFIGDQIIPLLKKLSFLLVYLFFIFFLLIQKHEDIKRNKRLNVWIVVANLLLIPVWAYYFSAPSSPSSNTSVAEIGLLIIGIPVFFTGIFMQLMSIIVKLGVVNRQRGIIQLLGLIIVMVYLFYRLAESSFVSIWIQ